MYQFLTITFPRSQFRELRTVTDFTLYFAYRIFNTENITTLSGFNTSLYKRFIDTSVVAYFFGHSVYELTLKINCFAARLLSLVLQA